MKFHKKLIAVFAFVMAVVLMSATNPVREIALNENDLAKDANVLVFKKELLHLNLEQILTLTPKKYKELTGQKLGLKGFGSKSGSKEIEKIFERR
ncbi:MAG: hypothetical protein RMJ97_11380 [Raineya sp.]|nr:hypothetical protein [Raineya sp.]MDW8297472.1 hypothetical protein [Raineya sp.]